MTEGRDPGEEAQLSAMPRKSEKGILGRRENTTEALLSREVIASHGREGRATGWGLKSSSGEPFPMSLVGA